MTSFEYLPVYYKWNSHPLVFLIETRKVSSLRRPILKFSVLFPSSSIPYPVGRFRERREYPWWRPHDNRSSICGRRRQQPAHTCSCIYASRTASSDSAHRFAGQFASGNLRFYLVIFLCSIKREKNSKKIVSVFTLFRKTPDCHRQIHYR